VGQDWAPWEVTEWDRKAVLGVQEPGAHLEDLLQVPVLITHIITKDQIPSIRQALQEAEDPHLTSHRRWAARGAANLRHTSTTTDHTRTYPTWPPSARRLDSQLQRELFLLDQR